MLKVEIYLGADIFVFEGNGVPLPDVRDLIDLFLAARSDREQRRLDLLTARLRVANRAVTAAVTRCTPADRSFIALHRQQET